MSGTALEAEWKNNFRITGANFCKLCDELRLIIQRQNTLMRSPVGVDKQVVLTLYYLSDEGHLRKTANTFGLSRSCVSIMIRRVTLAISAHLGPESTSTYHKRKRQLKQTPINCFLYLICLGAVNGPRIAIKQPLVNSVL